MTTPADLAEILNLERLGHLTWPALEDEVVHGWLVRAAAGVTRRSNSVNPLGVPTGNLEHAIDAGIAWLAERDLPPIFRLTPASPHGLDSLLAGRGLLRQQGAIIMVRSDLPSEAPPEVEVSARRSDEWMDVLAQQADRGGQSRRTVERLLDYHTLPTRFGLIRDEGQPVAVGMAVAVEDYVGIFNMRTAESHRRRGLARIVLQAMLAFGNDRGATRAFIQVHPENLGAISLYETAGFVTRYEYWYHQKAA